MRVTSGKKEIWQAAMRILCEIRTKRNQFFGCSVSEGAADESRVLSSEVELAVEPSTLGHF
jgi:hypothetical protein